MNRARLAGLALGCLVLTGCVHAQGIPANTLRIAIQEEPDSLNPALANLVVANDPIALLYDGLIKFDGHGDIVPDLAVEVPTSANGGISRDGRTLTYHLRHNVRWQDGAPFTSRDVAFTWRVLTDKRNKVPATAGYDKILAMQTPDPYTVRVVLREPYAPALALFRNTKQGAILPEHLLAREPDLNRSAFNAAPIGTGPYRLLAWRHGESLEFLANRYYWQRPYFERVSLRVYPDESAGSNALLSHDVDAILSLHASQVPRLRDARGISLASNPTYHWEHLTFNLRPGSGPQANVHVRRAIAYAIDVARLDESVFHQSPQGAPLDQAPSSWARAANVAYYPYDVARAREEMRASGYQRATLSILSTVGSQQRLSIEEQLQQMLREAGIELNIKNVAAPLLLARAADRGPLFGGNFQLALFAYETPTSDPDDERYVATSSIPPNGLNIAAFSDAAVDRLVHDGQTTYDRGRRYSAYAQIQRRLIADLPFYTLAWTPEIVAYRSSLAAIQPAPVGSDLWNITAWHPSSF